MIAAIWYVVHSRKCKSHCWQFMPSRELTVFTSIQGPAFIRRAVVCRPNSFVHLVGHILLQVMAHASVQGRCESLDHSRLTKTSCSCHCSQGGPNTVRVRGKRSRRPHRASTFACAGTPFDLCRMSCLFCSTRILLGGNEQASYCCVDLVLLSSAWLSSRSGDGSRRHHRTMPLLVTPMEHLKPLWSL